MRPKEGPVGSIELRRVVTPGSHQRIWMSHRSQASIRLLHRPFRRSAALAGRLARPVACWGVGQPATLLLSKSSTEVLGGLPDNAALMDRPHRSRWVAVLERQGIVAGVVKVSQSKDRGLRNEREMLDALTSMHLPDCLNVPRVLESSMAAGAESILLSPPGDLLCDRAIPDNETVIKLVCAFAQIGVTHGDFAPWNFFETGQGLFVYDWELGRERYEPSFDLAHYFVQSAILLRALTVEQCVARLVAPEGPGSDFARRTGLTKVEHRDGIRRYLTAPGEAAASDRRARAFRSAVLSQIPG